MSIQERKMHEQYGMLGNERIFRVSSKIYDKKESQELARQLSFPKSRKDRNIFKEYRNLILKILDTDSWKTVPAIIKDQGRCEEIKKRAIEYFPGLEGKLPELKDRILREYGRTSDTLIEDLANKYLNLEMAADLTNEVKGTDDPGQLLLYAFEEGRSLQSRYEAKRKLMLMITMSKLESTLKAYPDDLQYVNNLINERLEPGEKGHRECQYLCTDSKLAEAKIFQSDKEGTPHRQKAMIHMRYFQTSSKSPLPFHWDERRKKDHGMLLKALRKDKLDISGGDDYNGLRFILRNKAEARIFLVTLEKKFGDLGFSKDKIEYDFLGIEGYLKFVMYLSGRKYEVQIFTPQAFIEYNLGAKAWEIYEIDRVFDSNVMNLLFPQQIYGIDLQRAKKEAKERTRSRLKRKGLGAIEIFKR